MENSAQVKAAIPRDLKRRAFAAFAMREEKFNRWLRTQLEGWLQEVEDEGKDRDDERLVGSQARG